jgi:beta-lactamase regulating signal transducer with metallopeptidase domain
MNLTALLEFLDRAGARSLTVAGPLLLQSSLLILLLLGLDRLLRRRARPALRHALWLLVPLKLLLPPSLAMPTGIGYWLADFQFVTRTLPLPDPSTEFTVRYDSAPPPPPQAPDRRPGSMTSDGRKRFPSPPPAAFLVLWLAGSAGLLAWLVRRTLALRRFTAEATSAPEFFQREVDTLRARLGLRREVRVKLVPDGQSPALCGLRHPTILLPKGLADRLDAVQRRTVLLHELAHARRGDLAVHAVQMVLLVIWWWHPLVWLANARLRAVREECVDDTVAYELGPDADTYPATLLEVARAALQRPRLSLGLVGILESRSALRTRIQRLLDQPPTTPTPPELRWPGRLAVALIAILVLPMARRPASAEAPLPPAQPAATAPSPLTARHPGRQGDRYVVEAPAPGAWLTRVARTDLFEPVPATPVPRASRPQPGEPPVSPIPATPAVPAVPAAPAQFVIEAKALLLTDDDARALHLEWATGNATPGGLPAPQLTLDPTPPTRYGGPAPTLNPTELKAFLAAAARRASVQTIATPRVVTLAGLAASIEMDPDTNGAPGFFLSVEPGALTQQGRLPLAVTARLTEHSEIRQQPGAPSTLGPGAIGYLTPTLTNFAVLPDHHTLVLTDVGNTLPPGSRRLMVLVTSTQIDAAGNPLHPTPPEAR